MRTKLSLKTAALAAMILAGSVVAGQEVSVAARFDTTSILTGDQIWFTVTFNKPDELRLMLQQFTDSLADKVEILRGPVSDTVRLQGREVITDKYLVTVFDSGRYEIPPVFAEYSGETGVRRFYSDYSYLMVSRPDITPPDSTMPYFDIIGPYRAPVTPGEILPWFLAAMLITAIAYFTERYYRNRKKPETDTEPEKPMEAAHIIAYRSLEKLKGDKLWQKQYYKEYYTRLSDILRNYIDMRYGLTSLESTTDETLMAFSAVSRGNLQAEETLRQVLTISDMVKFAKLIPDNSDCELSMEQSWSFVSMTRKEMAAPSESGEEEAEGGEGS